ncbi:MAG: hypothetical protein R6W68_13750 [Ignavibacteriaceae bacterium]
MKSKYLRLIILIIPISFNSCNEENPITILDTFHTKENSINHLKLEISSTESWLKHTENIDFTSDTILVTFKIEGIEEGSGMADVHLYYGVSTTVAAYYSIKDTVITDTLLTDTLIYSPPDRATINFHKFTGSLMFEMNGQ